VDWTYVSSGVQRAVVDVVRAACTRFEALGARIREVRIPEEYARLVDEWGITCGVECAQAHRDYYPLLKHQYGPVLANLIELGLKASAEHYAELQVLRDVFRHRFDALLDDVQLFIAPCMPMLPRTVAEMETAVADEDARAAVITFTAPFDYSGHPTLTLPAGLSADGLPQSFQLVGSRLGEASLIRAGAAYEALAGTMPHPSV
jgi:amidase